VARVIKAARLPNSVIVTYGYDADSRPTGLTYGTGGSWTSPARQSEQPDIHRSLS